MPGVRHGAAIGGNLLPDIVTVVTGAEARISLNGQQRLIIETAHGLIELRTSFENPDRSARFLLTIPSDLRWRKGAKHKPVALHTKFLDIVSEIPKPMFQLLSPVVVGETFYLRGVSRLRVASHSDVNVPEPLPTPAFVAGS